ncbi:MAG: hypothetical protein IKS41_02970 [Alphaproteobacteria bacterium]|nr:hypothetical protein [Alphaproteobacteria bacterium]
MLIQKEEMDKYYNRKSFAVDEMGQKQGAYTEYYDNGQLACEATYRNDRLNGSCRRYHRNGQLCTECTYRCGKMTGAYTEYYDDGKPHVKCFYKGGLKDGLYEEYAQDGGLLEKKVFQNGEELTGKKAIEYLKKWTAEQAKRKTSARHPER